MKKFIIFTLFSILLIMVSCTDQEKDPCPVYIDPEAKDYANYAIDITSLVPPTMKTINLYSKKKNPSSTLSSLDDTKLDKMVTYWERIDGGTIAPKPFELHWTVLIPAGGQATLNNVPLMADEQLLEMPFTQLLPENGGRDPETGNMIIVCRAKTYFYCHTVQGCDIVAGPMYTTFEFYYGGAK